MTNKTNKNDLLLYILKNSELRQVLLFSRTKHGADRIVRKLQKNNIQCSAIHGDKSQNRRQKALQDFKISTIRVLVATDIAARGIDIDLLPQVVNFELPNVPEDYVHRIGRTARAGRSGTAITLADPQQSRRLHYMQKDLKVEFEKIEIPSDKMIATAQRRALWDELLATMEDGDFADARGWVDSMLKDDDGRDLAAAAIALLARAKGMRLNKKPDAEAPAWTKINARAKSSSSDGRRRRGPRGRSDKRRSRGPNSKGSGGSQGPSKGPSKSRPRRG